MGFRCGKNQFAHGVWRALFDGMMRSLLSVVFVLFSATWSAAADVIRPKVVVVAMFEAGADTGDRPGEFQYWVEREKLTQVHPFPQGYRDLRTNADGSVLGVVTGVGTAKSAATIMALGLDPRFDLSQSYWLVAGIAAATAFRTAFFSVPAADPAVAATADRFGGSNRNASPSPIRPAAATVP